MKFIKYFCAIAVAFGINAEVIANTQKVLSAAGLAVNEDIKVEFGEGIGETKDEALKEAIRDVLQRVVGTYLCKNVSRKTVEIYRQGRCSKRIHARCRERGKMTRQYIAATCLCKCG